MKGAESRRQSRKLNPGGGRREFGGEEFLPRRGRIWEEVEVVLGEKELTGNAAEVCLVSPKFLNLMCYIPTCFPFSSALLFFPLC